MKIIIAGGGTTGWLAALAIVRAQPQIHQVTLIQSQRLGIIGTGEGSTGLLRDFLQGTWFDTGIDIDQFMQESKATPKIGIKHVNWTGDGSWYFAPLDGSKTCGSVPDVEFCQTLAARPDKVHLASNLGRGFEQKVVSHLEALHFDAHGMSGYLSKVAIASGVQVVDAEIVKVMTNRDRTKIEQLITAGGVSYEADFFIDCSGFHRILAKALDVGWTSYRQHLPVNSAITFQLPLDRQSGPLTIATAMNAGWMWMVPITERYGCGYVYASDFISKQQAHDELCAYHGQTIDILRDVRFESGCSQLLWKNNCLMLGLAAAFTEPLEATSIHSTIMQIITFVLEYLDASKSHTCQPSRIEAYNQHMLKMYDDLRDFLVIHYMGGRTDTAFWQHITAGNTLTPKSKYILELAQRSIPSALTFDHYYGCVGAPLYNWVLAGLNILTQETARNTLQRLGHA